MVYFEAFANTHLSQHFTYRRMLDLSNFLNVLDERVNDTVFVIEEGRQMANADIAIAVDGEAQNTTSMLLKPCRIVGPTSEQRYAVCSACEYHCLASAIVFEFRPARCAAARA